MLPPAEQFERACRVGDFVAEIVGPAAIGVYVVEMLMEVLRQQPGHNVEIFVVMRGEPAGVFLRGRGRAAGIRGVAGDVNFAGEQHQKRDSPREERSQ